MPEVYVYGIEARWKDQNRGLIKGIPTRW